MSVDIQKEDVVRVLMSVIDPEMHIDIYTLGLIYNISLVPKKVIVLMTLTTPLCPYADEIVAAVKASIESLGVEGEVQVTFTPPWEPPQNLRAILGV